MFRTPNAVVLGARIALALLAAELLLFAGSIAAGTLAPLPVVRFAAAQAHGFLGLFLATVALPWHRRHDLLMAALGIAAAVAALGTATTGLGALGDGVGLALGALAASLPVGLDRVRRNARLYGDQLFEVIAIEDRRAAKRRGPSRTEGEAEISTLSSATFAG